MDWPQRQAHTPVASGTGWTEWRSDERYVYIGLPGYGDGLEKTGRPCEGALFGKPWSLVQGTDKAKDAWRWAYRDYLVQKVESNPIFAGAVLALHGKTLVCWCKGKPTRSESPSQDKFCHGDMLAYAAERLFHSLPDEE
jgi:hypothetical protein